ncbi:MAG: hypothetical protein HZA49_05080 [Planctomycetes bacterium]|nr:hypothetical protein [Planctomycetota bacterium]
MKYFHSIAIIASAVFCCYSTAYSQVLISEKSSAFSDSDYKISISEWVTRGDFRMHGGPPSADNIWELTHPVDGGMTQLQFSYTEKKNSPYTMNISLGGGNIRQGTIRDTDWDAAGVVSDLSYSTSNGETLNFSFTTDYLITDIKEPYEFYLTFGYNYLDISADYRNAVIAIDTYVPTSTLVIMKWQVYDLLYQGLEIGVKGKSEVLADLLLTGSLSYAPFTMAEYKGTRYPGTGFDQKEHIIAYGSTLNYEIKLSYDLSNQLIIDGGYRYSAYRTEGKDQPDSAWSGSWENLDADFKGFFFGSTLKF